MQLTLSIYLKQNVRLLKCCRDSCYNLVVTEQTLSSYRKPHKIVIPDICWGDLYLRFFFHRIKKTKPDMEYKVTLNCLIAVFIIMHLGP